MPSNFGGDQNGDDYDPEGPNDAPMPTPSGRKIDHSKAPVFGESTSTPEPDRLPRIRPDLLRPRITVEMGELSQQGKDDLTKYLSERGNQQPLRLESVQPYVRVTKRWSSNSGWASKSWLYYVDIVNAKGESARTAGVTCHAGEMNEYGKSEEGAQRIAREVAAFFGWEIRYFEDVPTTTVITREVKKGGTDV